MAQRKYQKGLSPSAFHDHFLIHVQVLFTTPAGLAQVQEAKVESQFAHIETFKDLTSGLVEFQASQLHKKFAFTHVCPTTSCFSQNSD